MIDLSFLAADDVTLALALGALIKAIVDAIRGQAPQVHGGATLAIAAALSALLTTGALLAGGAVFDGATVGRLILIAAAAFAVAVGLTATHKSAVLTRAQARVRQ